MSFQIWKVLINNVNFFKKKIMKNEEKFTIWFGKIRINDYDDYIQLEKMLISLCDKTEV